MATKRVRIHVILPEEMMEEIIKIAGPRRRSEFIAEAVENELRRRRRSEIAHRLAGSLSAPGTHIPEWDTPESAERWLRDSRRDRRDPWRDADEANLT